MFKNKNFVLLSMMLFLFFISSFYLIKTILKINNIENTLRYLIVAILILLFSLTFLKALKIFIKKQNKKSIILSIILVIFFIIECTVYNTISKVYSSIDNISSSQVKHSSSLITLKDNKINRLSELKNKKIGIYNDKESIDGYIIPNEIIKDNNLKDTNTLVEYDNLILMINAMYDKEVDAIFLNSNYPTLFSFNGFSNIKEDTIVLFTKEMTIKEDKNKKKNMDKPFAMLLMGVDSTYNDIKGGSAFNGDALLLITFNPKTLNTTMLSIPRDTYVPIACFKNNRENKITHAAWYGQDCMIKTIEDFTKINIDYYAKINFKGLVKLVDTLGGINVDVPYSLCEQNSSRLWGKDTVFLEKGYRKINGEQALALSRNRHKANDNSDIGRVMANYCPKYTEGNRNDLTRGQNQQKVISGIISELKNIRNLDAIYSLLDLLSTSIQTNVSTSQILSMYNIGKDILLNDDSTTVSFDSLYLLGTDTMIWDPEMKLTLYNYYYNRDSLKDIVRAMNINLEREKPNIVKSLTFSINSPYEKIVIGKGPYSNNYVLNTLPNFKNKSIDVATSWGNNNKIKIVVNYVDSTLEMNNIIKSQSIPHGYIVKDINKDLIIEVGKYTPKILEEDLSKVPDFKTYTLSMVSDWKDKVSDKINVTIDTVKKTNPLYDEAKAGKFYKQSISSGISIENIEEITISFFDN